MTRRAGPPAEPPDRFDRRRGGGSVGGRGHTCRVAESIRTDAVVVRRVAYGEADLIVTAYTRARGKVSALARSARRSRRRFGGALELFTVSEIELRERPRSELHTLAYAEPRRVFPALATGMAALAHAGYGTELVRELTAAEQPDPAVFDLLVELYEVLSARGAHPPVLRAFELRLLGCVGLAPALDRCVGCGAQQPRALDAPGAVLDTVRGGVICGGCAGASARSARRPMPAPARRLLVAAQRATTLASMCAGGPPGGGEGAAEARDAMLATLLAHIGKPLRSVEFVAKLGAGRH